MTAALPRRPLTPATPYNSTLSIPPNSRPIQLRSGFSTTALRAKDQPPEDKDKDAIEEEVEEETKRKDKDKKKKDDSKIEKSDDSAPQPKEVLKGGSAATGGRSSSGGKGDSGNGGRRKPGDNAKALQKPTIPEIYPQVMALPITKRPLFPGFYKAVTIKDPAVAGAIKEMMNKGQPYIGAFLFKDENADGDVIESLDEVYETGVFAQITSAFPVNGEEGAITAVLYPHRRIKITNLLPRNPDAEKVGGEESVAEVEAVPEEEEVGPEIEEITEEYDERKEKGDVVASFEEGVVEKPAAAPSAPYATSFLQKYNVSVVDVENLAEEPHDKKDPVVRAVTSEIVNVFKEVANLNPLFRDQISTFSMSQTAGNVIEEPAKLADFAAAVSSGEIKELQEVLEALSVRERLQKALVVLKKELMNAQLQSKISKDVEAKIQKRQREYWLMEQMKGIKRELGMESDGKDKLVEKFKDKASKLAMPEAVKKVFDEVCYVHLKLKAEF